MPWPFYNRDLVSYGYGIDLLESNSILVVVRSVLQSEHDKHFGVELSPANTSTCTRMDLNYAGFMITPISANETYVCLIGSCDPKFSYIPGWFMNSITHHMSHLILRTLRKLASNMASSEYERRIKENKAIYGDIMTRLEKYFKNGVL